ncbi:MLO-like protein 6 isoform X2 [Andrographis paniculata]|uniref:MLO-like protein 6 isoform X2 n=1 Tax=Andrographis paniculata TaxID=175694 RepID=UPI0021E6E29F|nr:MLO-like protein 6 isoform X2 [Andrographis paniculata]
MAGKGGRSLEETPTWAVAVVCFVLVAISIIIEHILHLLGKWLSMRNKKALYEALEKIKSELMLLGFLSLLLTVGQGPISKICVSNKIGNSWHPCNKDQEKHKYDHGKGKDYDDGEHRRRLLLEYNQYMDTSWVQRRVLAGGGKDVCADKGQVPLISSDGIHQLHIFIFVLAVFHVICCLITLALGRLKMRKWKAWEEDTKTAEYQYEHDPERFRFARDTSFGRRHMSFWSQSPILLWVVCFLRQFVRSVPKVDYLTLRHGFIIAHLAPQSQTNFDFQNYIKRTLEEDFKVVVGISPPIWLFAVLFLLFNTHGWRSYLWLPFIPLIIILLVGTKLQVIITMMGLRFQKRGEIVKGAPVVQPGDNLFWFNRPRLLLYLIQFVFFQNAFQLAFFTWAWLQFGRRSCFHQRTEDVVIRISMGVLVQILCSYVTLPLYALVTQMGSNMKPTIFNERVAKALQSWHQTARKQIKKNRQQGLGIGTPMSSIPSTPRHISSPPPSLLPSSYTTEVETLKTFTRNCSYVTEQWPAEPDYDSLSQHRNFEQVEDENDAQESSSHVDFQTGQLHLEINAPPDFSFNKNSKA